MNTKLIRPLLRKEKLTHEGWIEQLEHLRATLNPHLDKFTLSKFGDLACMDKGNGFYDEVSRHRPDEIGPYKLKDHGMSYFEDSRERLVRRGDTRTIKAWGLSKKGEWVTISIGVELLPAEAGHPDWEHAKMVDIRPASLDVMLEQARVVPYQVLGIIANEIDNWERKRLIAYEEARDIAEGVRLYSQVLLHNFV